nr:zinc finger CCCH domain-containing protein 19 [Tanacetum cinerariifolium]
MAIGTGHRSNNYSESKRNDHLDNYRRQEQRNEGEIHGDSVLYNDGCIKDCMEKNLKDDAGEILGVHSQGDCYNVTTYDNEDAYLSSNALLDVNHGDPLCSRLLHQGKCHVTPVIAPEKDSIIVSPSTPPGNDLNLAVESGSSWLDYVGPLTSDELDSVKRWSYRDPIGNIHSRLLHQGKCHVTPFIAPEKDSIIVPPSIPPGNDLNIAVESGSSWLDYVGPLTSDELDSVKRWSYRDHIGNIHGLFSLAQLRTWKDYFSSDLQIWSYYDNVKEAILLHNALSRQTKDAG